MTHSFDSSAGALTYLKQYLKEREMTVIEEKTVPTKAGRGTVYQKQLWTATREIFHIKHWSKKWVPKESSNVSEFAKPLDERLKYAIKLYGKGDPSASGINEGTLMNLLEIEGSGFETYLVTTYSSGDVLWCKVAELYNFASMYGLIPQFSMTYGEPFCWIPTGWLKPLSMVVAGPPGLVR